MKQILEEVKRLVLRLMARGASSADIDAEVQKLLVQRGFDGALMRETQRAMEREWASQYTLSSEERAVAAQILERSEQGFARARNRIVKGVANTVLDGLRRDQSSKQVEGRLVVELKVAERHASTIVNTARAAFSRGREIGQALDLGLDTFRYDGAGAQRPFCIARLGNVYTIDEIRLMDNGMGLPVLYYCGGWRCVHTWTAVERKRK